MTDTPGSGPHDHAVQPTVTGPSQHDNHAGHGGHGWMMILCCIPMLLIAAVLLAVGVVSVGFLVFAVACTAMMAFMMRGMSHGG
jgi:hypothetical protein